MGEWYTVRGGERWKLHYKILHPSNRHKYYKHLDIRKILFVLQLIAYISSFVCPLKLFLFFRPSIFKYFKTSSNTLLRLSVCTVWPSLLIFFFHFYSFPADHSIKSLSDFWRSLLGNFLAMWYQKHPERPLWHWREAGWGQDGLFLFTCVPQSSNDRAQGKPCRDNSLSWGSRQCLVPSDHICEAHQRNGVNAMHLRKAELGDPIWSEPRVEISWILIWKGCNWVCLGSISNR